MAHLVRRIVSLRRLTSPVTAVNNKGVNTLRYRSLLGRKPLSWAQFVILRRRFSTESVRNSTDDDSGVTSTSSSESVKGLRLSDSCVKVHTYTHTHT